METLKFSAKPSRTPHFHNHFRVPQNSRILGVYVNEDHSFSCTTLTCKLKTSKGKKTSKKKIVSAGKISLLERKTAVEDTTRNVDSKVLFKQEEKKLSNLPLAIAGLMALGEAADFYFHNFPEVEGFFTAGLNHLLSSAPIFLGMLALLGASLMTCTCTTQIPLEKVATRSAFAFHFNCHICRRSKAIQKQANAGTLPRPGHEAFLKHPALSAFKGLAGQFASIGLLLVMSGGTLYAPAGSRGEATVPQHLNFVVGDVLEPSGPVLMTPSDAVYETGEEVPQFNLNGKQVVTKTVSGRDPLRYNAITIYQTDRSFLALQMLKNHQGSLDLATALLQLNGDRKLFCTFLRPVGNDDSPNVLGISMIALDWQSFILYDKEGKGAGVGQTNSKIRIAVIYSL